MAAMFQKWPPITVWYGKALVDTEFERLMCNVLVTVFVIIQCIMCYIKNGPQWTWKFVTRMWQITLQRKLVSCNTAVHASSLNLNQKPVISWKDNDIEMVKILNELEIFSRGVPDHLLSSLFSVLFWTFDNG